MHHSLHAEGFGIRLRPVRLDDAAFIVWLRNLDHVKGRVGDSAPDVASQEAWLENYFEREGDYYFIAETPGGIPLGTHGIYDVRGTRAEKGRHVIRPEVLAGVPVATLVTDLAFGRLGLSELRSTTLSTNFAVQSLHRKSGFKQVGIIRAAQNIGGRPVDLVEYLLTAEDWFKVRDRLLPLANLAGTQVLEWEKTQLGKSQPWNETKNQVAG
jgi:RimJ/RimL family protein N-acetyltransferase